MKRIPAFVCLLALAFSCGEKPETPSQETTKPVTFTVQPSSLEFTAAGGSQSLALTTDSQSWKATVSSGEWATVSPASGTGSRTLTVTVPAHEGERRMVTVSFSDASGAKGSAIVSIVQDAASEVGTIVPNPAAFDNKKRASTTYQLLIYSFADSNGDGVGDFKGIQDKLDYLDGLGVAALWLSPAHPTSSYHGYDVDDYYTVNPLFGTEQDFKNLIDAAHARDIKIYMDYVLNHSGSNNSWFKQALADPSCKYRDYYVFSDNPTADVAAGKIDNYGGAKTPGMGEWHSITSGDKGYKGRLHFKLDWNAKTITVTESTEAAQTSNASAKIWLYFGDNVGLYETSSNVYEITYEVNTSWGFLVRTSTTSWDNGTKWGGNGGAITLGTPYSLNSNPANDIIFGGSTSYYFASFATSMPDLNYGPYASASESGAFQDIAATADKWIKLGVDGFRLDAVIWIYQEQVMANQSFLKQWYDHCNATYQAQGHSDSIFMVGEAWKDHNTEKLYYKGIPSCFEFEYFDLLTKAVSGNAGNYVTTVNRYLSDHSSQRTDAITSLFMTNHDQNRAAESLGRNAAKEKQAAAMLLTTPGKPFIYQGEELGYYGKKDGGDEYVRTPVLWDNAGKDCAKKGVNNKVDNAMLTSSISVEAQDADANSLLTVYKTWSRLRNTYPALDDGTMTVAPCNGSTVAAWYMTGTDGSKLLVIHHGGATANAITVSDDMSHPIALLGTASVSGKTLKLGANSSVVFQL